MNKYIISTALMCILVACNTLDNPSLETTDNVIYIEANSEDGITKGSVDGSGASAPFTWNTGDQIAVYADGYKISDLLAKDYNNLSEVSFGFGTVGSNALVQSNRANFAIFPISLVYDGFGNLYTEDVTASSLKLNLPASYSLSQVQNDVSPTPMIASNTKNGSLAFKALCPLLRITVVNIPKQTKSIEFDFNGQKVQGEFTLTSVEAGTTAIATTPTAGTDDIITVTMADNTTWHDNLVINLPVPAGTYGNITITAKDEAGLPVLTLTKAIKAAGWAPTRKSSRKMTATLPVFSVSATKKVTFAPGNLQYQASTGKWRFAENQYDYLGDNPGNNTVSGRDTQTDWIDLFGWATSGWPNTGEGGSDVPSWEHFQPWAISAAVYSEDTNNYYHYGPNYDAEKPNNLVDYYANGDWGMYNTIGDYAPGSWRLPTGDESEELQYLLENRSCSTINTVNNAKYVKANVVGVSGIIIFPDNFSWPSDGVMSPAFPTSSDINNKEAGYSYTVIDSGWSSLESAGAIFLPAAGFRNGETVDDNSIGYYWSSTAYSSVAEVSVKSRALYVSNSNVNPIITIRRYMGLSVRLIRDLN